MPSMSEMLILSKRLFEEDLQKSDVKAIFKSAEATPKNWLGKSPETGESLISKWKNASFPTDSRDIVSILKSSGYSDSAINKVFGKAGFGSSDEVAVSPAIQHLANFIITQGYTADILSFMKSEYPKIAKSYVKEGTMDIESIREIFTQIMNEDAEDLPEIRRQRQQENLGRTKK